MSILDWRAGGDDLSGAYLFLPNGEAKSLQIADADYVVIDGPLRKKVIVKGPEEMELLHTAIIDEHVDFVKLTNEVCEAVCIRKPYRFAGRPDDY